MSQHTINWHHLAMASMVALLGACAQTAPPATASNPSMPVASNPPPVPPGANAVWYHVGFDTNSFAINASGKTVIADVTTYLQNNPNSVATIIGRTDTVGSKDYNMHLAHRRADAVRDALVYRNGVKADRVETRWTGESRQSIATADEVAETSNRVVDIAIH